MELGREAQRHVALHFIGEDLRRQFNNIELEIALTRTPEEAEAIQARVEEWAKDLLRVSGHCLDRVIEMERQPVAQQRSA